MDDAVSRLDLLDLNYALYRCDAEERDEGHGGGAYVVEGSGAFVYCGLEGIMSMLTTVRKKNDLGHPICNNLRSGDWLADYTVKRLRHNSGTNKVCVERMRKQSETHSTMCFVNTMHHFLLLLSILSFFFCSFSSPLQLATVLDPLFNELSRIPRYLIPCYFEAIVSFIYSMLKKKAIDLMGE